MGTGQIMSLDDKCMEMEVAFDCDPPPALPANLVLALPRPIMLKRILTTVSSMGVKNIILFHSKRVEKSYWRSPILEEENITEQLVLGLEQARDTILPKIQLRPLFKPFVEDELSDISRDTLALVADPQAADSCPRDVDRRVTLVIGPEGGFIPYEMDKLTSLGFSPIHVGKRVLRVETVVPVFDLYASMS